MVGFWKALRRAVSAEEIRRIDIYSSPQMFSSRYLSFRLIRDNDDDLFVAFHSEDGEERTLSKWELSQFDSFLEAMLSMKQTIAEVQAQDRLRSKGESPVRE